MKKKKKKTKKIVDLDAPEETVEQSTKNDEASEESTNKENEVVQEKEIGERYTIVYCKNIFSDY